MRTQRVADYVATALLVALGAATAIGSLGYGLLAEDGRVGPGFMPFVAGVLLVLFGGLVGWETWRRGRKAPAATNPRAPTDSATGATSAPDGSGGRPAVGQERAAEVDEETGEEGSGRTVAAVFGLTLVAILLTPVLGFLISFGLLVFALVRFVERESAILGAALGVGAAVALWLVFVVLLSIPLPEGVFEGLGG